jgi:proline dehydrogenase
MPILPDFQDSFSVKDTKTAFASRSDGELQKMEWLFSLMNNPGLNKLGISIMMAAIEWRLPVKTLIKKTIFDHFCGGETWEECARTMNRLADFGIGTILDYSVEGEKTESAFDHVLEETIGTIRIAAKNNNVPFAVFKTSGICGTDIMELAQSGNSLSQNEKEALERGRTRFAAICEEAGKLGVKLFVDAEETWIQGLIDQWTYEEMEKYNQERALIFNTFQMYRWDMLQNLKAAYELSKTKGFILGGKLVRGAYMEKEAAYALKKGKPNPIQPNKESCDRDFNLAWKFCLENLNQIHFCAGSHNESSNEELARAVISKGLGKNDPRIWFAQLFGMSDNISYSLAKAGFNVAKYVPYGPVYSVMPYLVRRAAENTSVAGQTSRELNLIRQERNRRRAKNN